MKDSNNSGLFRDGLASDEYMRNGHATGGNEYGNDRAEAIYDPFAQSQPVSGEPLFPTTPAVTKDAGEAGGEEDWMTAMPESIVYEHSYQRQQHGNDAARYRDAYEDDADLFGAGTVETTQDWTRQESAAATPDEKEPAEYEVLDTAAPAADFEWPVVEVAEAAAPEPPKPVMTQRDMLFNRHFMVLSDLMQHGAWPQALEKLHAMRAEFPDVPALDGLLDEATLKAELMGTWAHKIKGRRLTVGQEWLIRRSVPFVALLTLFLCGVVFYQSFVAPSRQVVAMERANQALIEEAAQLVKVGHVDAAIRSYNDVLRRDPDNVSAQQGLADASKLVGLATTYDLAIRVANQGNLERALLMLQSVKAKSPSFRDIDARITRVNSLLEAENAYEAAERAFVQHRWTDAIVNYEAAQRAASDYQAVRVGLQLSAAYAKATQSLMHQWPTGQLSTGQMRDFVRKAQELNGVDDSSQAFVSRLDEFMRGEREVNDRNLPMAIRTWEPLYEAQPDFLGGYLAEQLYRAYLALAAEVRASDADYARELYSQAAALPVSDSSEARQQLQSLQ